MSAPNNQAVAPVVPEVPVVPAAPAVPAAPVYSPFFDENAAPSVNKETIVPPAGDGDELDDDQKLIIKTAKESVAGDLAKVQGEVRAIAIQNNVNTYLNSPDGKRYAEYREQILKSAFDPRMAGMRIDAVVIATIGQVKVQEILSKEITEAQSHANSTRTNGGTQIANGAGNGQGTLPPAWDLPEADFLKQMSQVRSRA